MRRVSEWLGRNQDWRIRSAGLPKRPISSRRNLVRTAAVHPLLPISARCRTSCRRPIAVTRHHRPRRRPMPHGRTSSTWTRGRLCLGGCDRGSSPLLRSSRFNRRCFAGKNTGTGRDRRCQTSPYPPTSSSPRSTRCFESIRTIASIGCGPMIPSTWIRNSGGSF